MSGDPKASRADASEEDAQYALIPIRRDLVAEIDSVRDDLSRTEYLRLLLRQTEANQLDTDHHRTGASDAGVTTPSGSSVRATKSRHDDRAAPDTSAPTNRSPQRSSNGGVRTSGEQQGYDGRDEGQPPRDSRTETALGDASGPRTRLEVGTLGRPHTANAKRGVTDEASNSQSTTRKQAPSRSDGGSVTQWRWVRSGNQNANSSQTRHRAHDESGRPTQRSRGQSASVGETPDKAVHTNHDANDAQFAQETGLARGSTNGTDAVSRRSTTSTDDSPTTDRKTTQTASNVGSKWGVTAATEPDSTDILSSEWRLSIGGFIIVWALAVGLYGAGDSVTTIYALAAGTAVETNPIVRAAISIHPLVMLLLKLVIIGGLFKLADNLGTNSHPSMDDQLAALIPTILSLIGAYGTVANLQNLNGAMVPYVVLSVLLLGFAGGATVALYKGIPLNGNKLKNYQFSEPLSSIQHESNV